MESYINVREREVFSKVTRSVQSINSIEDAATLLEAYTHAIKSGVYWRNIRDVVEDVDGFYYFILDQGYRQGTFDVYEMISKGLGTDVNVVNAKSLLGTGRGVSPGIPNKDFQEDNLQTGFLAGANLLTLFRKDTGETISIENSAVVGRGESSDIRIIDPGRNISRKHLRVFEERGTYFIEDLGSSNGTFLNGNRVPPYSKRSLSKGDTLTISTISLEVR